MADGLLLPLGLTTFFDNNGDPLAGGFVYFYVPNTSTFKDTWQDGDQGTLNTNPVELDSAGRATIWGSGPYRQLVNDSLGNLIWDRLITLPETGTEAECGPVLYAGVSVPHNEVPNGAHQQIQMLYCDMTVEGEGGPEPRTVVSWVAGLDYDVEDPATHFQIWILDTEGAGSEGLGWSVRKNSSTGPVELEVGDVVTDNSYLMMWNEVFAAFILLNPSLSEEITDGSVTNAKLADRTGPIILGRNLGSSGPPLDLTPTQTTAMLDPMVGDSGTGGTAGLVPAPAAGDAADGRFLKADGSWAVPPGDTTGGGGAPDDAAYLVSSPDGALPNARVSNDTATVSWDFGTSGVFKANVVANSVGSAQLAQIATARFLGRLTGGTGNVEELTGAQATTLLSNLVGDSGAGGTKGLVPAPAAGDTAAGKFLKADGSWSAPSGTGAPSSAEYITAALDSGLSAERVGTNAYGVTWDFGTASQAKLKVTQAIQVAASDETTALTTGTAKVTFRMPFGFVLTDIRASLTVAQASGSIFTVDVKEGGVSILSTLITIDNTELTSVTAVTAPVISDANLADDASMTVNITQIGDGTAKGLKVSLIGYHS